MTPGQDLIVTLFKWFARWNAFYAPPYTPPPVQFVFLRKDSAMSFLVFALKVAPPATPVAKRTLTLTVNGTAQPSFEPVDGAEVKFGPDDVVSTSLVDTSLTGVDSGAALGGPFKVSDLVPPATPEAVSFVYLRTEADPVDPTPEVTA